MKPSEQIKDENKIAAIIAKAESEAEKSVRFSALGTNRTPAEIERDVNAAKYFAGVCVRVALS